MVFEHIDKLKQEYTGKYVVVDERQPELRRFVGLTGTVQTVNMNGRALIQFDGANNIGWYDIDVDFLKVIDKPLPKPEEKAPRKPPGKSGPAQRGPESSPAPEGAPPKPTETSGQEGAAALAEKPAESKPRKTSAADILAAARAAKHADAEAGPASGAKSPPPKDQGATPDDPRAAAD